MIPDVDLLAAPPAVSPGVNGHRIGLQSGAIGSNPIPRGLANKAELLIEPVPGRIGFGDTRDDCVDVMLAGPVDTCPDQVLGCPATLRLLGNGQCAELKFPRQADFGEIRAIRADRDGAGDVAIVIADKDLSQWVQCLRFRVGKKVCVGLVRSSNTRCNVGIDAECADDLKLVGTDRANHKRLTNTAMISAAISTTEMTVTSSLFIMGIVVLEGVGEGFDGHFQVHQHAEIVG